MVLWCSDRYFSRADAAPFTSWALAPQRLVEHATDPALRAFYGGHGRGKGEGWHFRMRGYAESGFAESYLEEQAKQLNISMPRGDG